MEIQTARAKARTGVVTLDIGGVFAFAQRAPAGISKPFSSKFCTNDKTILPRYFETSFPSIRFILFVYWMEVTLQQTKRFHCTNRKYQDLQC